MMQSSNETTTQVVEWGSLGDGTITALLWILVLPILAAALRGLASCNGLRGLRGAPRICLAIQAFVSAALAIAVLRDAGSIYVHSGRPELADSLAEGFVWALGGRAFPELSQSVVLDAVTAVWIVVLSVGFCIRAWARREDAQVAPFVHESIAFSAVLTVGLASSLVGVFLGFGVVGALAFLEAEENSSRDRRAFVGLGMQALFLASLLVIFASIRSLDVVDVRSAIANGTTSNCLAVGCFAALALVGFVVAPTSAVGLSGLTFAVSRFDLLRAGFLLDATTFSGGVAIGAIGLLAILAMSRTAAFARGSQLVESEIVRPISGLVALGVHASAIATRTVANGSIRLYVVLVFATIVAMTALYAYVL